MSYKPLIIIMGEPYSIFLEIFFKTYKKFIKNRMKLPVVLIGSSEQLIKQMNFFNYNFKIRYLKINENLNKLNNKQINLINIELHSQKIFTKNLNASNLYIEKCFGKSKKNPTKSELKNKKIVRKSIVAKRNIQKGEKFRKENLTTKRPGNGISPMKFNELINLKAKKIFLKDELIKI